MTQRKKILSIIIILFSIGVIIGSVILIKKYMKHMYKEPFTGKARVKVYGFRLKINNRWIGGKNNLVLKKNELNAKLFNVFTDVANETLQLGKANTNKFLSLNDAKTEFIYKDVDKESIFKTDSIKIKLQKDKNDKDKEFLKIQNKYMKVKNSKIMATGDINEAHSIFVIEPIKMNATEM